MRPVAYIKGNPEIHEKYIKNTDIRLLHFAVHAKKILFFVALQPNTGHGLLILEVSRSHKRTYHSW
jgi:hypothetical protein